MGKRLKHLAFPDQEHFSLPKHGTPQNHGEYSGLATLVPKLPAYHHLTKIDDAITASPRLSVWLCSCGRAGTEYGVRHVPCAEGGALLSASVREDPGSGSPLVSTAQSVAPIPGLRFRSPVMTSSSKSSGCAGKTSASGAFTHSRAAERHGHLPLVGYASGTDTARYPHSW